MYRACEYKLPHAKTYKSKLKGLPTGKLSKTSSKERKKEERKREKKKERKEER